MRRMITLIFFVVFSFSTAVVAQESIAVGDTVEGVLSTAGTAEYTFQGERGQYVQITLESRAFDAYLRLLDFKGGVVVEDDDSAGNLNAQIGPLPLPETGAYTIVVTSLSQREVGEYTLSLSGSVVERIEYSQTVTGELTEGDTETAYTFTGQMGDSISIDLMSDDFDTYLTLSSVSSGAELAYNDDAGGNLNSRIGPFTLPETGEYIVTVTAYDEEPGSFTLTLNRLDLDTLAVGESVKAEISGSRVLYFSFEGSAGQVVDIEANSGDALDTMLTLIGPDSFTVASDDDSGGRVDPAMRNVFLAQDGTYYVVVQPNVSRDAVTSIDISLSESPLLSLDEEIQTIYFGELDSPQYLTFTGNANEQVFISVVVAADVPISPDVAILQNGEQVARLSSYAISGELTFGFMVPYGGPVLVQLSDYDYIEAELTVILERE